MKPLTLCLLLFLSGCSPQLAAFSFSRGNTSPPLAPAPILICTASMTADVPKKPPLPQNAGFPAPTTETAKGQVSEYLTWLRSLSVTFNLLAQRAEDTRQFCLAHQKK